ncbi:MAG: WYL domain-containing protein [Candidatus Marinimicrobia bacterium]|nr:WYL domain-containing protein [Candidatus Neomarinimicrobiota bacterium]
MGEFTQIERLIRILQILSAGRKITTKELLDRFDGQVSRRTLQRDLLTLQAANIPLESEKLTANENVWFLLSRFRSFIPLPLSSNEYLAAHILRSNLKVFSKTPFDQEIQSLINKIDQLVPDDVFLDLKKRNAEGIFENYTAGLYDYSSHGETIDNLICAIIDQLKCRVSYLTPGAIKHKSYFIEPEKLVYYNGGLYCIVFMRHYERYLLLSIQRILKLNITKEEFIKDHPFDEQAFWSSRFGLFPGEREEVILRFSNEISVYIDGRTWHTSQQIERDINNNLILNMNVAISPELVSWIMSWHKYVVVISPDSLCEIIKENINAMNKLY